MTVEILGRGFAWLDTGTHESLLQASHYIETVEKRQGLKVACLEEIAYLMGYISKDKILEIGNKMNKTDYGKYLISLVE
ncbi:Glucose-1-phosphate thymidylyltransferase [compost metagenome]